MIYENIKDLIGKTPTIKLNAFSKDLNANIFVKLESFNPMGSVKDRLAQALIADGEKRGLITKETTLIEATSGNTGIGLAFLAAAKGHKLILTMPDTMSTERRKLLKALGATLILTPGVQGMKGAIEKANELNKSTPNSYIPGQFTNPANVEMHAQTTAIEIWEDFGNDLDFFIAGVGTGGTISGVAQGFQQKKLKTKIIAVEPSDSPVLSGGQAGPHKLQGIGAGFIPSILRQDLIDEVLTASSDDAGFFSRKLAKEEGILMGISSGAALSCAVKIAERKENTGKNILAFLPSSGERYLSTWLYK